MDQVSIKYTTIFHCKSLQNLPKFGFLFENKPSGNPVWIHSIEFCRPSIWLGYFGFDFPRIDVRFQQGCQIFLTTIYQNGEKLPNNQKIYQMAKKYTNGCKTYQIDICKQYKHLPLQYPPIFTQMFFCLKYNHLATLVFRGEILDWK
jgi:hypothetical protein